MVVYVAAAWPAALRAVLNPRLLMVLVMVGGALARGWRERRFRERRRRSRQEWRERRARLEERSDEPADEREG